MVRRPSHAGELNMEESSGSKKKTAIIALVCIGLLAGGAIGLGVGLSSKNSGENEAATIETASLANEEAATASTLSAGVTATDSGTMATDLLDAAAGGTDDPATGSESTAPESTAAESTGSESTGSEITGSEITGSESTISDSATGTTDGCADGDMTCTSGDGASATPPDQSSDSATGCRSILEIATATPELSTLVQGIQAAELTGTFANRAAVLTVLAPSNAAFAKIPEDELSSLLANEGNLTQVLKSHVVPGVAPSNLLRSGEKLSTLSGTPVTVYEAGSKTKFSDGRSVASVTTPDVMGCRGFVHIIDTVLVAPSMLASTTQASDGDVPAPAEQPSHEDDAATTSEPSDFDAPAPTEQPADESDDATTSEPSDFDAAAPIEQPADENDNATTSEPSDDVSGGDAASGSGSPETEPESGTDSDAEPEETGRPDYSFTGVQPGSDGKWTVCAGSWRAGDEWNRPCGVEVAIDGKVTVGEYFGGFDGYFSFDPSDSHENCFNQVVVDMFGMKTCEYIEVTLDYDSDLDGNNDINIDCQTPTDGTLCACAASEYLQPAIKAQRGKWPGNVGIREFLKTLRDRADPVNYDFPEDQEVADNGGRVANQKLVEDVFTSMLNVVDCSQFK